MADEIYQSRCNNSYELDIKDSDPNYGQSFKDSASYLTLDLTQKPGTLVSCLFIMVAYKELIAEFIGTYFLVFGGCSAVALNMIRDNVVTLPGIALAWGMIVMVMIYSVGHISGAHFNPAVTIAFATAKKFPWNQVPAYILVQVVASTLASGTIRLVFRGNHYHFVGTLPSGSNMQSLVLEFIATFYLMFVIYAVSSDLRSNKEFVGVAVGATVSIDILFTGPITGASMNPARSLGPAIVWKHYGDLWIYIVGPIFGAVFAVLLYNIFKLTNKSLRDIKNKLIMNSRSSKPGPSSVTMERDQDLEKTIEAGIAICNCPEGWKCVIFKIEEVPPAKSFFECGQGCKCEIS